MKVYSDCTQSFIEVHPELEIVDYEFSTDKVKYICPVCNKEHPSKLYEYASIKSTEHIGEVWKLRA